jgi:hypothetical protein
MNAISKVFIENARSLLTANYRPKIERCLDELTDGQIWTKPNDASNSIGNLLLHLCGNIRQYIISGVGKTEDIRKRQVEFETRGGITKNELKEKLLQTLSDVDQVLERLTESQLLESRRIQGRDITVLEAIFKVVEHFSMHAGQIIVLTKILANKDLKFYIFPDGPNSRAQTNWK